MSASCVISTIVRAGLVELVEHFRTSTPDDAVEVARRLVGEDHARLGDERPGDRHALLLTAGELGRLMTHPIGEPQRSSAAFARSMRSLFRPTPW